MFRLQTISHAHDRTALISNVIPHPQNGVVVWACHNMPVPERPLARKPLELPGYLSSLHDRLFLM